MTHTARIYGTARDGDNAITDLMGRDAQARYDFVMATAGEADDLDI